MLTAPEYFCEHCQKDLSARNATSRINHIRICAKQSPAVLLEKRQRNERSRATKAAKATKAAAKATKAVAAAAAAAKRNGSASKGDGGALLAQHTALQQVGQAAADEADRRKSLEDFETPPPQRRRRRQKSKAKKQRGKKGTSGAAGEPDDEQEAVALAMALSRSTKGTAKRTSNAASNGALLASRGLVSATTISVDANEAALQAQIAELDRAMEALRNRYVPMLCHESHTMTSMLSDLGIVAVTLFCLLMLLCLGRYHHHPSADARTCGDSSRACNWHVVQAAAQMQLQLQ